MSPWANNLQGRAGHLPTLCCSIGSPRFWEISQENGAHFIAPLQPTPT